MRRLWQGKIVTSSLLNWFAPFVPLVLFSVVCTIAGAIVPHFAPPAPIELFVTVRALFFFTFIPSSFPRITMFVTAPRASDFLFVI